MPFEILNLLTTLHELRKAALKTSHRLLRCQVVFTRRCYYCYCYYITVPFLFFEFCHNFFYSFVTIWVLSCNNLSCHNFCCCHHLSFGVWSQLELSCQNLCFWVLSRWVFMFYPPLKKMINFCCPYCHFCHYCHYSCIGR